MGMDLVRSCYETDMRFWADSAAAVRVKWFFCDNAAQVFPHWHRFGSGNWASDDLDWPGAGEVLGATRKWVNGERPPDLDGHKFCGPLDAYQAGAADDAKPLNADVDGICCCCSCNCGCAELTGRFADEVTVTIMAITGAGAVGFVGQQFTFTKVFIPPKFVWEGPVIDTPGGVFPTEKLYIECIDFPPPGFEKVVWLHQSGPPYTPFTGAAQNIEGQKCDDEFIGLVDAFDIGGDVPGYSKWTLKVHAKFIDTN